MQMVLSLQTTKQGLVAWSVKNSLRKRASRILDFYNLDLCQQNFEQLPTLFVMSVVLLHGIVHVHTSCSDAL